MFKVTPKLFDIGIWAAALVAAGVIGFALATVATAEDDTQGSCVETCDAAMDACTLQCDDHVDNEMCPEECLAKHDHCVKKCGE